MWWRRAREGNPRRETRSNDTLRLKATALSWQRCSGRPSIDRARAAGRVGRSCRGVSGRLMGGGPVSMGAGSNCCQAGRGPCARRVTDEKQEQTPRPRMSGDGRPASWKWRARGPARSPSLAPAWPCGLLGWFNFFFLHDPDTQKMPRKFHLISACTSTEFQTLKIFIFDCPGCLQCFSVSESSRMGRSGHSQWPLSLVSQAWLGIGQGSSYPCLISRPGDSNTPQKRKHGI